MSEQDNSNNKLVKPVKLGTNSPSVNAFGLKGKIQQAQKQGTFGQGSTANTRDKIIIVADDSGSMSGTPFEQQKKAIQEFLKVCSPVDTAVGIVPMNMDKIGLTLLHTVILSKVLSWNQEHLGGTPTFSTLNKALAENPTRVVLISDGGPTDGRSLTIKQNEQDKGHYFDNFATKSGYYELTGPQEGAIDLSKWTINSSIQKYIEKKIIIDTVFVGAENDTSGIEEMRAIAELTGGQYIFFKEGKSFAQKFKYLAPAYYGMLTSGSIKL